jgi:hypothetical protein
MDWRVGTIRSISVSVHDKLGRRGAMEAMLEGALEVAEDALHNSQMGLMGVVHAKARLLDHVDVRPGEGRFWRAPTKLR